MMVDKILGKLEYYIAKIQRIYNNLKSRDHLRLVDRYFEKIDALIPAPIIIKNAHTIRRVMEIKFMALESEFICYGKIYGLDFLNILMYIHGASQSNLATAQRLRFAISIVGKNLDGKEGIQYRMFKRLLFSFDGNLLSSIEFLLKNCSPDILEKKRNLEINHYEYVKIIKSFIEDFDNYLKNKRQLLFSKINDLVEYSLVLGPGFYTYFRVVFKSQELADLGGKTVDMYLDYDINYDKPDFDAFLKGFSYVKELWLEKMGYQIENFVLAAKLLAVLLTNNYRSFFSFKHLKLEEGVSLTEAKQSFYDHIGFIIKFYLENPELEDTFINFRDLRNHIKSGATNTTKGEIAKIIRELCVDPQKPYKPLFNCMANRFLYPVNKERAFFYINNIFNALSERFFYDLAKIDENSKENVFLNRILYILSENGFRVHPLSGHQIVDDKRKTIGEIDIIAFKNEFLLYIESKIMSQKSVSPYNYDSLVNKFRKIEKKFKKFDRNISNFNKYCQDPDTLNHFLKYTALETLELSQYSEKKYFFVTPYLTYQPISFKPKHNIELINLMILKSKLRNLIP